ncbi:MAG: hypothetical protein M5U01_27890 [Ardenticatenaceae bacterium]|nr:hypothetical protein [Ardenticatenaceae bacterium]
MSPAVALVAPLYDADGGLLEVAAPLWPLLRELYCEIIVEASRQTPPHVLAAYREAGALVFSEFEAPNNIAHLGQVRLRALQRAVARGHSCLHLCDWDRALHWARTFPDELRTVLPAIPDYDFLVMGRTRRAFDSHPHAQRETEHLANEAFAAITGEPFDVSGGSRGVSATAAVALQRWSRVFGVGSDGEWPVLAHRLGLRCGWFAAEGLEFETADRFAAAIAAAGSYEAWLARAANNGAGWVRRLEFAAAIAAGAFDAATRTDLPDGTM